MYTGCGYPRLSPAHVKIPLDTVQFTRPADACVSTVRGPFELEASDNAVHQAVVPRLCAAINRSTLLLGGGNGVGLGSERSPEAFGASSAVTSS
jgi:hypothetical protein